MRILLVSDHYPPFIGGAHRQTQLLGHELRARGHAISVATVWHGGSPAEADDEGVKVYRLRQLRTAITGLVRDRKQRHQPPYPDPVTIWQLRRVIRRERPEVVHAYGWMAYSAAVALTGIDVPLLVSARDYGYSCASRTLLYRDHSCTGPAPLKCLDCTAHYYGVPKGWAATLGVYLSAPLLRRRVTGLHSISTYVQEMMRRDFLNDAALTGGRKVPHVIIPSFQEGDAVGAATGAPVDADLQPYVDQLPAQPFMLFVGALRLVKGLKPLLAAYTQLKSPPPLVLIGTVEHDTPRDLPPGVVVLQNFPHRAVMAAWDHSLFGVLPSLWAEPLGSVVYEGMSRGKAVIGTTPGGHTDMIVPGETGLLVPAGDVETLRAAMQRLLDDPALRQRFGAAGLARSRQFTADVAVPQFERAYQLVAAQGRHA